MPTRPTALAALVFVAAAAVGGGVVWQADRLSAGARREAAASLASSVAFSLEQQLSRSLSATYALAAAVRRDPTFHDFEQLAPEMLPIYGGLASLQLAPGAVVSRIHPAAGNEAAMGHDLLRDPDRRFQAEEAIRSRRLTVAGPFVLKQGGLGLVGRLAVFLPDRGAAGGERFWGLVTAVVMLPPLLDAAQVGRLGDAGYAHRLARVNPERGVEECFDGCAAALPADPVAFTVGVPNGAWVLEVAPRAGWSGAAWARTGYALVLAAAAALALLARKVLRQPELLRRQVEARTAELAATNAALASEMAQLQSAREATRAAEDQLRQARKMEALGQLAGGIAHDFNNLLTAILGYASVLRDESREGTESRVAAETVIDAARRAAELTRQLLRFARQEPLHLVPIDAHEVLREATRLLARTLDARSRILERYGAGRAIVVGDAGQFQQAIVNLAVNARDAMRDGGDVVIETCLVERDAAWCARQPGTRPGTYLAVSVADTGHGIPAAVRDRIFDPFFTTKEQGRGTGLGLAVVYGVARSHGGAVEVASEEGQGTRFTLSLPLAPEEATAIAPPRESPAARGAHGTVLLVDDDRLPREAVTAMLRTLGYSPVAAASCGEAVEWVKASGRDVRIALVDVAMPGADGVACFEALRALLPGVPLVFISGYAAGGRAQAIAAEGKAGFLAKPFDLKGLAAALDAALPVSP